MDKYGVQYVHPLRYMYLMELVQLGLLTLFVVPPRRGRLGGLMREAPSVAVITGILRYDEPGELRHCGPAGLPLITARG